jgi:isopentenyl diphosphate isomerase/L-lactate dehydrogenase-like FMN-dependent dehydrogenase
MLNRAKKAGYTALVVTLDTYILGWRPSDMDNGYVSIISIKSPSQMKPY